MPGRADRGGGVGQPRRSAARAEDDARLQAATSSDPAEKPVLLRLETKAGHGQGKPRAKLVEELTDVWSFVFWQLGMKE